MKRPLLDCPTCHGSGFVLVRVLTRHYGKRATEASCPTCCAAPTEYLQQWRATYRWQPVQRPCKYCDEWTHLRDEAGAPAHWLCAAKAAEIFQTGFCR
jgi:hypothetical protein